MIQIIPFQTNTGQINMDMDASIFESFESGEIKHPTLRLYGWKRPCITLGHSQDPEKELYLENCVRSGIEVIKRPTGGGIVFHNEYELTYSLVCDKQDPRLPKGLISSYKAISGLIIYALMSLDITAELSKTRQNGFARLCFSFPSSYEITYKGQKIVGSAQKRGKKALLQQGSIFIKRSKTSNIELIRQGDEYYSIFDLTDKPLDREALSVKIASNISSYFS